MTDIKRYNVPTECEACSGYIELHEEGDWVSYADYAALQARYRDLRLDMEDLHYQNSFRD